MRANEFIIEDQADNPDSWESQAADAERDAETAKMAAQDAAAGGLAEQEIDEDLSRRGFLKGVGAAAVAGVAGSANAQSPEELDQARRDNLKRIQQMASSTSVTNPAYANLVVRRILPNIVYLGDPFDPRTEVELRVVPDGTIISRRVSQSSGNKSWDEAVIQAIDKIVEPLPRDNATGRVPPVIVLNVSPKGINESVEQGVAEEQLDEKSVSKAQFRTMAAAAHNPKFAKKVGISPDVAREFHGADKGANYKKLPKKAAEDASWGMAPEGRVYK